MAYSLLNFALCKAKIGSGCGWRIRLAVSKLLRLWTGVTPILLAPTPSDANTCKFCRWFETWLATTLFVSLGVFSVRGLWLSCKFALIFFCFLCASEVLAYFFLIGHTMADFKALPDETTIKEASDLEVFDINGDKVKFGSIFSSEKAIVVFISMK